MAYTLTLRVYQTNPSSNAFFNIVEKTAWWSGSGPNSWTEVQGQQVLNLAGSGACGTLRFLNVSNPQESFLVAVGVHNYKRWCDIVPNLTNEQTGATLQPLFYQSGTSEDTTKWKQLSSFSTTNTASRKISINFTTTEGNNLVANIIIA